MSKEASVAPKERVNIVYRPADGDGREDVELPMKMLVTGDFTGVPDDRPMEKRDPVAINKDNFSDIMRAQGISLQFNVPNRLTGTRKTNWRSGSASRLYAILAPMRLSNKSPS